MSKTVIMDHPLVQHKVSLLRNKNTGTKEFKELVSELAMLLCYEATRDLPTEEVEIETPIAVAKTHMLSGRKVALVPILRAGLGMVDGMLALIDVYKRQGESYETDSARGRADTGSGRITRNAGGLRSLRRGQPSDHSHWTQPVYQPSHAHCSGGF